MTTQSSLDRPRSSDRVLQLLCVVGGAAQGLSLTEAAGRVGLVPSTALRQLRSLEAAGLLARDEVSQLYSPGPELVRLARVVFAARSLPVAAQPHLDALVRATGESAYLAVNDSPGNVTYVATAPGTHALRHSGWLGQAFAGAGTAAGGALRDRVDADGVVSRTGKLEKGITAVGAPVRTPTGIIAAINLVGPSFRLAGAALLSARVEVAAAAKALSESLGY